MRALAREGKRPFILPSTHRGPMAISASSADLHIVQIPIGELRPDPANPRKIGDAELDAASPPARRRWRIWARRTPA